MRSFLHEHRIAGDVIVNGEEVARAFGGIGKLPTTLVIIQDGHIAKNLKGLYRREQYEKILTYYGIPKVQDR